MAEHIFLDAAKINAPHSVNIATECVCVCVRASTAKCLRKLQLIIFYFTFKSKMQMYAQAGGQQHMQDIMQIAYALAHMHINCNALRLAN